MKLTMKEIEAEAPAISNETFEIELPSGEILALPHPSELPGSVLLISNNDQEGVLRLLRAAAALPGGDAWNKLLDSFTTRHLGVILHRYLSAYGAGETGEGSASPRTSNGTARPSRPTSRSKAKT